MPFNPTVKPSMPTTAIKPELPKPEISLVSGEVAGRAGLILTAFIPTDADDQVYIDNANVRCGKKVINEDGSITDNSKTPTSRTVTYADLKGAALFLLDEQGNKQFLTDDQFNGGAAISVDLNIYSRQKFAAGVQSATTEPEEDEQE